MSAFKIVAVSDLHLDWVTRGVSRFEEARGALNQAVECALKIDADLFLFAGDICNPDSGSRVFRCMRAAQDAAMSLSLAGIDNLWLAGNHDVIEDGSGETTLEPLKSIGGSTTVLDTPQTWAVQGSPTSNPVTVEVLALPFTATSHAYDPAAFVRDALKRADMRDKPLIVLSHLNINGIVPGEETSDMPRGRDVFLPASLLVSAATVVIQGHYHRREH